MKERIWSNPITKKGRQTGRSMGDYSTRAAARAAVPELNRELREVGMLEMDERVVQPREITLDTSEGVRP